MLALSAFATLCEAYLGIWPNVELFCQLFFFKTKTVDTVPVQCGAASIYACPSSGFPKVPRKESCKK
jgi:hypothetical protein